MEYRNFIRTSIIIFLVAALIVFSLPKDWRIFIYYPNYLGMIFLASAFFIYLPQMIFRFAVSEKREMIKRTQATIASAFFLNALGEFGLYKLYVIGFEYDKLIHFMNSMLFSIVVGEMLIVWKNYSFFQAAWRATLSVFLGGIIWELWEFFSDLVFHTLEWGVYGQNKLFDTVGDIAWNAMGIMIGIVILRSFMRKADAEGISPIS